MSRGFSFKILFKDKKTQARIGLITTPHGVIETPVFVPVGTCGTIKSMAPSDLEELGVSLFFVNTYHLYLSPGADLIEKLGGLHKFISWDKPLITDSGGFQVFSLNRGKTLMSTRKDAENNSVGCVIKIDDDGATFKSHRDGSIHHFTPEKSIEIQKKLGADIMLCFDECTYYPATHQYAKSAMLRTHRWAIRCLTAAQGKPLRCLTAAQGKPLRCLKRNLELRTKNLEQNYQALYGVIQGGVFRDLREESTRFIASLPFDGIAIGGVSVGEPKKQMRGVLDWVGPLLPEEKPLHLLGVGEIDDIFEIIERGVDSFDCVMPTRLGRMGKALIKYQISNIKYQKDNWTIDIIKSKFADDKRPIDKNCQCYTCRNFSRAYINHLFRARELLGYRLLTYHNLYFVNNLVKEIRKAIQKVEFEKLKKEWLK